MLVAGPIFNSYLTSRGASECKQKNTSSSVITISSSSNSSSSSSKYNIIKSVTASINRVRTTVQNTFLQITTPRDVSAPSSSKPAFESFAIPPKNSHRSPSFSDGEDSLKSELLHFKPIIAVPKTPIKTIKSKILRVPSIRPTSTPSHSFSPCSSPFTPIDPKGSFSRTSAFSVFSVLPLEDDLSRLSTVPKLSSLKLTSKRGRKRKAPEVKVIVSETTVKSKRVRRPNASIIEDVNDQAPASRVTRSRKCDENQSVVNQDYLKKIKQEHEDFKFAKKIQDKLNMTNGQRWTKVELPTCGYNTRSRKN